MLSVTELIHERLIGLATDRAGGCVGTREGGMEPAACLYNLQSRKIDMPEEKSQDGELQEIESRDSCQNLVFKCFLINLNLILKIIESGVM